MMLKRLNVNKLKALKEPPVARAAAMEQRRGKRRRLPMASAAPGRAQLAGGGSSTGSPGPPRKPARQV